MDPIEGPPVRREGADDAAAEVSEHRRALRRGASAPPSRDRRVVPVARSQGHAGKALVVAGVGVLLAVAIAFVVANLASNGDVEVNLGDDEYNAGQVENLAPRLERDGGLPFLYQDLVGGDRNLFVQHRGDDPTRGWTAFGAFDPRDPSCLVSIDRERAVLVNDCDETVTYPLDGTGLRFFDTYVEDGRLYVRLNEADG